MPQPLVVPAALRRALVTVPTLALTACVTWRRADVAPASAPYLARARQVRVVRTDGAAFVLTGVAVAGDSVAGDLLAEGGLAPRRVAVALAEVQRVEVRGVDPVRTAGAVFGGAALLAVAAVGLLLALVASSGD